MESVGITSTELFECYPLVQLSVSNKELSGLLAFPIYQCEQGYGLAWVTATAWDYRQRGFWNRGAYHKPTG